MTGTDTVRAAIQAAVQAGNLSLAREIAEENELTGICLDCVAAPVEVQLCRVDPVLGERTVVWFCAACDTARIRALFEEPCD